MTQKGWRDRNEERLIFRQSEVVLEMSSSETDFVMKTGRMHMTIKLCFCLLNAEECVQLRKSDQKFRLVTAVLQIHEPKLTRCIKFKKKQHIREGRFRKSPILIKGQINNGQ